MKLYIAAKVIISHPTKNELLLVNRPIDNTNGYEPAGGRLDIDFDTLSSETYESAAIREAKEELNLDVELIGYLGSYHFFWGDSPKKCTHCNVYAAKAVSSFDQLSDIGDPGKYPIYPEWVSVEKILDETLPIRKGHIGLKQVFNQAVAFFYSMQRA